MRIRKYKNGDIIVTKAGNKSLDMREHSMKQLVNDYMLNCAVEEWEGKPANRHVLSNFELLVQMLADENEFESNERRRRGKMKKTYYITPSIVRRIASAAVVMFEQRENNLTFFTLTLPKTISHEKTNRAFTNFIKNLKKNYFLRAYVATYEHTKSGQGHYHCLFDMPFIDIRSINAAWANAINVNAADYKSLVRLPAQKNRSVVMNTTRLVKYLVKYMGKQDAVFSAKNYFIDSKLLENSYEELTTIELSHELKKAKHAFTNEFFSVYHSKVVVVTENEYKQIRRLKAKKQRIKQSAIAFE